MRFTPETVLSYLDNVRDRVLLMQNPVMPMPRYGELPSLEPGERRYVVAEDGVYVQAKTLALSVCARISSTPPLPFGSLTPRVELSGGLPPRSFFTRMCAEALAESPNEWAALVHWDADCQRYVWTATEARHRSPCRVAYDSAARDESCLVIDAHSHGVAAPGFSAIDDASDRYGLYFACVLGHCVSPESIRVDTRLVIDGLRIPLTWHPWEDDSTDIADAVSGARLEDNPR